MLKLFKYFRLKDWVLVALSVGLIVLQVWLELKMPDYTKQITMLITTEGGTMNQILTQGGYMLACALGSMASAIVVCYFAAVVGASFSMRLRSIMYDKVMGFSMEEINRFSTASLLTRTTNDVTQVRMIISMGLQAAIKAPIMAIWAITKIQAKSWQWSVATAAAVAIMLILVIVVVFFALPRFRKIQALTDNLNRVTRENLTGIRVVRAYNAEEYQEDKFEKANKELTDNQLYTSRIMALMQPVMMLIMTGLTLAVYWIGAVLIANADAASPALILALRGDLLGDMMAFSQYAMMVIMGFMMLIMIFIMLPRATVSAKRINEVLSAKNSIEYPDSSNLNTDTQGVVEFKNVSFKYPDADDYVIRNISFTANKGETVAFIGSTGSGKSTLINLIPRFYDATEGEILIDGVNVRDYKKEDLMNKIGYVPQRGVLFSGSVKSNIDFGEGGNKKTEEDISAAAETAQAANFIGRMQKGYDSDISQGGTNVSGGQKQRLSIARAIAKNPEIFIFDDSFSALDYKTDKLLRAALKQRTKESTSLIVAQRIGTIKNADKIMVLDSGDIKGFGSHDELMRSCEVYREIAYSQLSKEELENDTAKQNA